jgi:hydrogenase-4 component B
LRRVLEVLPTSAPVDFAGFGSLVRLPGLQGSISPGMIAAGVAVAVGAVLMLTQWRRRHRPEPVVLPLWACGAEDLTPRMQYTATSFAEPLQRVFDDVLRPDTDFEITPRQESRYIADKVAYRTSTVDVFEERTYQPVIRAVAVAATLVRRAHTGSVHAYLAYGALGVLVILVVAR